MPDQDPDLRVGLARIDGRLDGVVDRLDRQEQACERRAASHIDEKRYLSDRQNQLTAISELRTSQEQLRADLRAEEVARREQREKDHREMVNTRRWLITTLVAIGAVAGTVLVAVLA